MAPSQHLPSAALAVCLCLSSALAGAQTPPATAPATAPATVTTTTNAPDGRLNQRIEHIRIEDSGSRIDELRVGGETQTITVAPKGGMPAYEVLPSASNQGPANGQRSSSATSGGTRVWKILGF